MIKTSLATKSILFRSLVLCLSVGCIAAVPSTGSAKVLLKETFDFDTNNVAQKQGFKSNYCKDGWTTSLNGGVFPKTDDGCSCSATGQSECDYALYTYNGNNCYKSEPVDNMLVMGDAAWKDYTFSVRMRNLDNDTLGVVFRYVNSANYYAVWLSRDIGPGTSSACDGSFPGARLVKVSAAKGDGGGKAELIAASTKTYTQGKDHLLRVKVIGDSIVVHFDINADGKFDESTEMLFNAKDATHSSGAVGLYAYQNGAAAGTNCANGQCWFDDVIVESGDGTHAVPDEDKDGVEDAKDNCPKVANPKQQNQDGDLEGDACDDDLDGDGLSNELETSLGMDPKDADSDDDGLRDGFEPQPKEDFDGDGRTNGMDPDSDGDGLPDGQEAGVAVAGVGTDLEAGYFRADEDPASTTNPLASDSDGDGLTDSQEDANRNGKVDSCESDPNVPDTPPCEGNSDGQAAADASAIGDGALSEPDGKAKPATLTVGGTGDEGGCVASPLGSNDPWSLALCILICAALVTTRRTKREC
ncbi:MAG TPA: hypothetical protein DCQ06_02550 [Myxococcales bacterium]|nr:hypothetical protein [Myxococcales bacterium]